MNKELIYFLKIHKTNAQKIMKLIISKFNDVHIINHKFKIIHEQDYVFFPLTNKDVLRHKLTTMINKNIFYEIIRKKAERNPKYKAHTLMETIGKKIPEKFAYLIPSSYDIIGTIAIIEFDKYKSFNDDDDDLTNIKKIIAQGIMKINKNVKTVYEKKSEVKGMFRLRELNLLAGVDVSITIHKENNCRFQIDVKNVYFTPRLVFERRRITELDYRTNELIIDLFAGAGPFSIQIVKSHRVNIYAFDINPTAINFLKKNIKINSLNGKIYPYIVNAKKLLEENNEIGQKLKNKADRIIMNLPERSLEFINVAIFLLKPSGGIVHLYQFVEKPDPLKKAIERLNNKLKKNNWEINKIFDSRIVKAFSPKADLIALDVRINLISKN